MQCNTIWSFIWIHYLYDNINRFTWIQSHHIIYIILQVIHHMMYVCMYVLTSHIQYSTVLSIYRHIFILYSTYVHTAYCNTSTHISVHINTQREVSGRDPHSHKHIPVLYQYTQTNSTQRHKCSQTCMVNFSLYYNIQILQ